MLLDAKAPEKPCGVLVDTGTGKRIPFARKVNFDTGEYEYLVPAPDGCNIAVDAVTRQPFVRKGKAVGQLKLLPMNEAARLGPAVAPPVKKETVIEPLSKDEKLDGLEQYKKVFHEVWRCRGESGRVVRDRFADYLAQSDFLDCYVIKRHVVPGGGGPSATTTK